MARLPLHFSPANATGRLPLWMPMIWAKRSRCCAKCLHRIGEVELGGSALRTMSEYPRPCGPAHVVPRRRFQFRPGSPAWQVIFVTSRISRRFLLAISSSCSEKRATAQPASFPGPFTDAGGRACFVTQDLSQSPLSVKPS
jgi:hypothetical protein